MYLLDEAENIIDEVGGMIAEEEKKISPYKTCKEIGNDSSLRWLGNYHLVPIWSTQ